MSDSFDIENERIEILDDNGNNVVYRPMAIIGAGEEVLYVFGAVRNDVEKRQRQLRLMIVRREETQAGKASRYVICENNKELEQIVSSYMKQIVEQAARKHMLQEDDEEKADQCDMHHGVFEFCYCDQPEYLQ